MRTTTVSLSSHFDDFIRRKISQGRYDNESDVISAALRLLEEDEKKIMAFKDAIQEGIDSGIAYDFDPAKNLELLKTLTPNG